MAKVKITKVSGYVDTPIVKKCGTCEFLKDRRICVNKVVKGDEQVPEAAGQKIVNPENGCCNEWNPGERDGSVGRILFG